MTERSAAYPARWESDVVLSDGGTVHVRPIRADDADALRGLHARLSDESIYLRLFSPVPKVSESQLKGLTTVDYDRQFALVAELGGDVVAVARYASDKNDQAEVAFIVQDDQQGRGLGTILLEHLAGVARERGITRFVAWMLSRNARMLRVFADAGYEVTRSSDGGTVEVAFDIEPTPASMAAQEAREHISEARSVERILAPRSVAVIGASRREGTIGNGILHNLLDGQFVGPVYPVNPMATSIGGVRAYASVLDVPEDVDVAIVCVPAAQVLDVAEQCAQKGVHGLVVISAGFAEVGGESGQTERVLVQLARAHGMRMIGPNCIGVVNTSPDVRMNASFVPAVPMPGRIGFASQSGGLGIELLARSAELGLGISTFVSMGNKADVSGNDLLQYWEEDPATDVILLYLESLIVSTRSARWIASPRWCARPRTVATGTFAPGDRTAVLRGSQKEVRRMSSETALIAVAVAWVSIGVTALDRDGPPRVRLLRVVRDGHDLWAVRDRDGRGRVASPTGTWGDADLASRRIDRGSR